jgi:hypothetical protein
MHAPFRALAVGMIALPLCLQLNAAHATPVLIGVGSIPGTATDQSGLTGLLEDGVTPRNLAGGFGSAIAYTGKKNLYVATPDRGPADGATSYVDRLYTIRIDLKKLAADSYEVKPAIVSTRLLRSDKNAYFTGSAAAFDETGSPSSLRFDPEGVRVASCGDTAFVSDEYGPYLYEFDLSNGKRVRSLNVPNKFLTDYPSATPNDELTQNASGRQANRGMEGLAISPDGSKLYGIMQSPLIQDAGLDASVPPKRVGFNNRILELDVETGDAREFLYQLDSAGNGVSEILAVNDHQFLVIERDGKAGIDAAFKKIFLIDIAGATDIRAIPKLPKGAAPPSPVPGVTAVTKTLFIDMLAGFGLAGAGFPEKLEGLAFGPDLDDGRHLLIVTVDNDFKQDTPTRFFAFAVPASDLPGFEPQQIAGHPGPKCRKHDHDD